MARLGFNVNAALDTSCVTGTWHRLLNESGHPVVPKLLITRYDGGLEYANQLVPGSGVAVV